MRKLLGYRLKEEKYREAAFKLSGLIGYGQYKHLLDDITPESLAHDKLKQAGVMHWFEEVYEEEKFTGWAKSVLPGNTNWIAYFEDDDFKYGIDAGGDWFVKDRYKKFSYSWEERPATTEEIEQALIKEAKKRGFKHKRIFIALEDDYNGSILTIDNRKAKVGLEYDFNKGKLYTFGFGRWCIFKDGKWAEIIPTETLDGKTAIIDGVEYELKIKN